MLVLALSTLAQAAPGDVISATVRSDDGEANPQVLIALLQNTVDPPDPDFRLDGRVATTRSRIAGDGDFSLVLDVGERRHDVKAVYYQPSDGSRAVVVWGEGQVERFFPPDPCSDPELPPGPCRWSDLPPGPCAPSGELPPGPCFQFIAVLGDGTEVEINVTIQSDGYIDPGSLVGFNPQPEPPGDLVGFNPQPDPPGEPWLEIDFSATGREASTVEVNVTLSQKGEALALE